jgi:hypothetical protein
MQNELRQITVAILILLCREASAAKQQLNYSDVLSIGKEAEKFQKDEFREEYYVIPVGLSVPSSILFNDKEKPVTQSQKEPSISIMIHFGILPEVDREHLAEEPVILIQEFQTDESKKTNKEEFSKIEEFLTKNPHRIIKFLEDMVTIYCNMVTLATNQLLKVYPEILNTILADTQKLAPELIADIVYNKISKKCITLTEMSSKEVTEKLISHANALLHPN